MDVLTNRIFLTFLHLKKKTTLKSFLRNEKSLSNFLLKNKNATEIRKVFSNNKKYTNIHLHIYIHVYKMLLSNLRYGIQT